MKKRSQSPHGGNALAILIALSLFAVINLLFINGSDSGNIMVSQDTTWKNHRLSQLKQEKEIRRKAKLGQTSTEHVGLQYSLPLLDIFSNNKLFAQHFQLLKRTKDKHPMNKDEQYESSSTSRQELIRELDSFVDDQLAQCREVIIFNTPPLPGSGTAQAQNAEQLASELFGHIASTRLNSPGLFHRYIANCSPFSMQDDLANNGGRLRLRLGADYTDLTLMRHLYNQAEKNGQDAEHEAYGVEGASLLTPAMYTAYRLSHKIVMKVKEVVEQQHAQATREEKEYATALLLHDYLCENCEYSSTAVAVNNQMMTTYALLRKKASSEGYARAYRLLLSMAGIRNAYVYGNIRYTDAATGQPQTLPHCWNIVCIGGKWIHVDASSNDPMPGEKAAFSHSFFGMPVSLMANSHAVEIIDDDNILSFAQLQTDAELWYYKYHKLIADTPDKLASIIVSRALQGQRESETLYTGSSITPQELDAAIRQYMEQEKLRFDTDYPLHMEHRHSLPCVPATIIYTRFGEERSANNEQSPTP